MARGASNRSFLGEMADSVVRGDDVFNQYHPYCNDPEFVSILIDRLDIHRQALERIECYEACAAARDLIADLRKLLKFLSSQTLA